MLFGDGSSAICGLRFPCHTRKSAVADARTAICMELAACFGYEFLFGWYSGRFALYGRDQCLRQILKVLKAQRRPFL